MARPKLPWLERQSTNHDALVVGFLFVLIPLLLGALDATSVLKTLPLAAWLGIVAGSALIAGAYRLGRSRVQASIPVDVDRYVGHTTDAIDTLQLVISGEIDEIEVGQFVQEGIFEPAQTILSQRDRGDVRFSILESDGGEDFRMGMALGHSMESRRAFKLKIAGSFAGMTYADGKPRVSNDTENDDRFEPHPRARSGREYGSVAAVPIRLGHEVVAVLVVVAQHPDSFSASDIAYLRELGAIIGLARSISQRAPS
jgi:GAF domain-containing protein